MLTAASLMGDDATNQFNAAKNAFTQGDYNTARAGFEAFRSQFPTHAQFNAATFYLAESLMYQRQFTNAETLFNQLVALGLNAPNDAGIFARAALFRLAEIPYLQGQFDVAKPRLEDFVDKLSQDVNLQFVLYYLGDIAMRSTTPYAADEAECYFGQAVKMFPEGVKYVESQLGLAWAKNKLNKVTEANAIYQQLMSSTNPATVELATYQYGAALFERGSFQEAINVLTDFQRRFPASVHFADSQRVTARCMGRLNNFDGALQTISQITQPTPDDMLMKVRFLYGLKRMQEAKTVLDQAKSVAGTLYRDEIVLLESVFLTDQKDWRGVISQLESILSPQYHQNNNRMVVSYLSLPPAAGTKKMSAEAFFRACSLLMEAYANNRQQDRATALLNEMQGQAALSGNVRLTNICAEAATKLANVSPLAPGRSNSGGNVFGSRNDQWAPSTAQSVGNRSTLTPLAEGTDVNKYWRAEQMYRMKNYEGAALQLEQILSGFYNQIATPPLYLIHYNITGEDGKMNEQTFARACALLALSKAQLGDFEQATAILTTLGSRISRNDPVQDNLLRETYDQLGALAKGGSTTSGTSATLSETDQRRLLREANTAFRKQDYRLTDEKVTELIASNPGEAVMAEALFLQGKAQYGLGREQDSIKTLERIVDEYASSKECAEALWYLGLYYETGGDSVQAVEYFKTLWDRYKNFKYIDGALYYLAVDDMTNNNGRQGLSYLNQVYRNHRNGLYWSHAAWMLAFEAYKKRNYDMAEMYVQEILRNPPDAAIVDRVLYLKGELALIRDDYQSAFLAFKEVTKLCPSSQLSFHADKNARLAANKVNIN